MKRKITHETVVAYSECQRKAFLLLSGQRGDAQHEYIDVLQEQAADNRIAFVRTLQGAGLRVLWHRPGRTKPEADATLDATVTAGDLSAHCDVLKQSPGRRSPAGGDLEPCIVTGTHAPTATQKLHLAFVGHVIGEAFARRPETATVVVAGPQPRRVRLTPLYPTVDSIIAVLRSWASESPKEPPPVVLNPNCDLCPFRRQCLKEAEADDNLSLLSRMTPKLMRKYHNKGIFTVHQLSYLYKPRRRRKRKARALPAFNVELQALALRMQKVYLDQPPAIPDHPVELFLDFEGIPDQAFYYLAGLVVRSQEGVRSCSFWADTPEDEGTMFTSLLEQVAKYPDAPIYHYGSYEAKALDLLARRHATPCSLVRERLVNLSSFVFGKVYFPARSNRLKEIASLAGATWTHADASGLQSLVWRHRWEKTRRRSFKEKLVAYNHDDCQALRLLLDELRDLGQNAASRSDVGYADDVRQNTTKAGQEIHRALQGIIRSAHAEYARGRITIRNDDPQGDRPRKLGPPMGHQAHLRIPPSKASRVIRVPRRRTCPHHEGNPLQPTDKVAEHIVTDLVFTGHGCRKTTIGYTGIVTVHGPKVRRADFARAFR